MAYELIRHAYPGIAASQITAQQVVAKAAGSTERGVHPVATSNVEPFGVALHTASSVGDPVTIHARDNVVKVRAAASLGAGALIGVAAGTSSLAPIAGASGSVAFAVGRSENAAAAGEIFSLYVNPRQLSGGS